MRNKHANHKGLFWIETSADNTHRVVFEPANDTVWLNKSELAKLLGITLQKINASLKQLTDNKLIDAEKHCKYDLFVSGNHITYNIQELRLEVVIVMAFQVDTGQARLIREWVVRRCAHPGICINIPLDELLNRN